ncbi:DNA double-strand break repair Rad50 ATPase [Entamoeba marina]
MFIEEIIIDGFKSYARRTTIGKFDKEFNAITGLNGSGKSNILDAICFVLGIQNLSLVRAATLQELIYKNGQCGVTKATVTLVFDNTNKSLSPTGYDQFDQLTVSRQITVSGKNKYMLNGQVLPQTQILTFFRAIGLNVNNPHFLIMQGRVMKVLAMKPKEILGMVEEVTGTKMYESKRAEAVKVLNKKDSKLGEIENILKDEIIPAREKIRQDAEALSALKTKKVMSESLENKIHAYEYYKNDVKNEQLHVELQRVEDDIETAEYNLETAKQDVMELAEDIKNDALEETGEIEKKVTEYLKQKEVVLTRKESAKQEINRVTKKYQKVVQQINEVENDDQEDDQRLLREKEWAEERIKELELRVEKINGANQTDDVLSNINALLKNVRKETDALIRSKQKPIPSTVDTKDAKSVIENLQKQENNLRAHSQQIDTQKVIRELSSAEKDTNIARKNYEESIRKANFNFRYNIPYATFDKSKVNGLLVKLFSPKNNTHALALEVAAGPKIFHVVVDSDETAKDLLKNGGLRKRMTFVPLTKISPMLPTNKQLQKAKEIGGNKITYALDAIKAEDAMKPAMQYAFGNVLIAEDAETARKVCFNPQVMMKTVTVMGDLYDPSGVLTGGCKPKHGGFVLEVQRQDELLKTLKEAEKVRDNLKEKVQKINEEQRAVEELKLVVERKKAAIKELERLEKLSEEREKAIKERERLERLCNDKETEIKDLMKRKEDALNERKRLEKGEGEIVKKELLQRINKEKEMLKNISKEIKRAEEAVKKKEMSRLRLSEWNNERNEYEQELNEFRNEETKHEEEITGLEQNIKVLETEIMDIKARNEIKAEKQRQLTEDQSLNNELKQTQDIIKGLEKKYVWINTEKSKFNVKGTNFDFDAFNISDAKKKVMEIGRQQLEIERSVNKQIMLHQQKVENDYKELMSRKHIIETDKDKIVRVIRELDDKMKDAITKAFDSVNQTFGSIFSTLHPGASAQLVPHDGKSIFKGIEARVKLGEMWKESLIELSGGQKSLLALSLILAILVYKPSPLYILDEVDAALDVSNTQNFGVMLKQHFKTSQFVVVSLKSGMFDNANILFNTKVINNISSVTRTVGKRSNHRNRKMVEDN